jgi:ribonuclease HI
MEYGSDERSVGGGKKGNFSIANMYHNLCDFNSEEVDLIWSKVWKLKVPERVRTFMWLVMHKRLLTNSIKSSMGLGQAMCNYCNDVEENLSHVLRDCPLAAAFWNQIVHIGKRGVFYMGEIHHWLVFNLNNSIELTYGGEWSSFWAMGCYSLWSWRNKEIHEDAFIRPSLPVQHVGRMVLDYHKAMNNSELILDRTRVVSLIGWSPPKPNFVKLNTDGACKERGLSGCGGIVRGSDGEWIGGFAKCVGLCNAFIAEMWGVFEGLRYVRRMGFTKVELNVDSIAVVQVIKKGSLQSGPGSTLAKQIWRMLALDWEVQVNYVYREANKCVDVLANMGCNLDYSIRIFDSCPSLIAELFHADNMGFTTPRLIAV